MRILSSEAATANRKQFGCHLMARIRLRFQSLWTIWIGFWDKIQINSIKYLTESARIEQSTPHHPHGRDAAERIVSTVPPGPANAERISRLSSAQRLADRKRPPLRCWPRATQRPDRIRRTCECSALSASRWRESGRSGARIGDRAPVTVERRTTDFGCEIVRGWCWCPDRRRSRWDQDLSIQFPPMLNTDTHQWMLEAADFYLG